MNIHTYNILQGEVILNTYSFMNTSDFHYICVSQTEGGSLQLTRRSTKLYILYCKGYSTDILYSKYSTTVKF